MRLKRKVKEKRARRKTYVMYRNGQKEGVEGTDRDRYRGNR